MEKGKGDAMCARESEKGHNDGDARQETDLEKGDVRCERESEKGDDGDA